MPPQLEGVTPVLSMPFEYGGNVDWSGLERQVDYVAKSGITVVALGFGSELDRLGEDERLLAVRTVANHSDVGLVATVQGGSIEALLANGAAVADAGAQILMVRPPRGSEVGTLLADCCHRLGTLTSLPIVVQDAPAFTGVQLSARALADLAQVPSIVALKIETDQAVKRIAAVAALTGPQVTILGGGGGVEYVSEFTRGARGCVPFAAYSPFFVRLHQHLEESDFQAARDYSASYLPLLLLGMRSFDTALSISKELLRRKGVLSHVGTRLPCEPLDPIVLEDLDIALADLGRAGEVL